jgi:hypothetical protein
MLSIMQERQLSDMEEEKLGIGLDKAPLDPEIDFLVSKKVAAAKNGRFNVRYSEFTREETRALLALGNEPVIEPKHVEVDLYYNTYSSKEVSQMMQEHEEYKLKEEQKKIIWDSMKTTESEIKTKTRTKRMSSTRVSKR